MPCPVELLAYRDDVVIADFIAQWDVTGAEAAALFEDAMAWLWASPGRARRRWRSMRRSASSTRCAHQLVLHTERYVALCERWFGGFVHHRPEVGASTDADPEAQWRFLAAELGVDRLLRWYVELPLRHDDAWFRTARRADDTGYRPTAAMIARWQARRGHGDVT